MPRHVVIVGVSTRAAAESAARAGFEVTAIDAYADRDQHAAVRSVSLPRDHGRPFTAAAAARAARAIACEAAAYLSNLDNHPRAVSLLAQGRSLWGNTPSVLQRVRDPHALTTAIEAAGFAAPLVWPPTSSADVPPTSLPGREWLIKPRASGGGRGIRVWRGERVAPGSYLQERVDGVAGSLVFVAAHKSIAPLGLSRQLVGEPAFGAHGFRYCGNILAAAGDELFTNDSTLVRSACGIARAAAATFDLVGLNGLDFVARDDVPWPVEINPRWSSSMELVERAYGLSMFGAHAAACDEGTLPDVNLQALRVGSHAVGKAIIFARHPVIVGETDRWCDEADIRDIPHPGERIAAGSPVCTIFADAASGAACHAALVERAVRIHAELDAWRRPSSDQRVIR